MVPPGYRSSYQSLNHRIFSLPGAAVLGHAQTVENLEARICLMTNKVKYQDILRYKTNMGTQSNKYRPGIGDNEKKKHSRQGFPLRRASASSVRYRKRWRFRNRETPSGHLQGVGEGGNSSDVRATVYSAACTWKEIRRLRKGNRRQLDSRRASVVLVSLFAECWAPFWLLVYTCYSTWPDYYKLIKRKLLTV